MFSTVNCSRQMDHPCPIPAQEWARKTGRNRKLLIVKVLQKINSPKKMLSNVQFFPIFSNNCTMRCRGKLSFTLKCTGTRQKKLTNNIGGTR